MRVTKRDRVILRALGDEHIDLRYNWARRLRNAVLCLTQCDPRWMVWVEKNVPAHPRDLARVTRKVEARARWFVLKPHGFLGRQTIGQFLFRDDWAFTDQGNLSPG